MRGLRLCFLPAALVLLSACAGQATEPADVPASADYCRTAQRVIGVTDIPVELVVHADFQAFVKSKTNIAGPTIHQYNWYSEEGRLLGISCKMKSAEHLSSTFGEGSAGPEGLCHDMNRALYAHLSKRIPAPMYASVIFERSESLDTPEQNSMIGPLWLKPLRLTEVDTEGRLHIATRGFVVRFDDPRFLKLPPTWRGTHYCHLIAPEYFERLLLGEAEAGAVIGGEPFELRGPGGERALPSS